MTGLKEIPDGDFLLTAYTYAHPGAPPEGKEELALLCWRI